MEGAIPDPDNIKLFFDILSVAIPGFLTLVSVVLVWWARNRAQAMIALKDLHEAQRLLADEQRQQAPNVPGQIAEALSTKLADAVGPLAELVKSLSQALERSGAKHLQLQLEHDRVCADVDNFRLELKTRTESWQRENTDKDAQLKEANVTVERLTAEVATLRARIVVLEGKAAKVDILVTEKEELQKERDAALARAVKAESLAVEQMARADKLAEQLTTSEAGRAKAEAELLKTKSAPSAPKASGLAPNDGVQPLRPDGSEA